MLGLFAGRWPKTLLYRNIPCLNTLMVVYATLLLCWSTACFISLLSFTQLFYNAELNLFLAHCWGIPYLITLPSNTQKLIHCWATPNPNTLLRYSLFYYIAEHFPISRHIELYPILTRCWGIPNFDLLLRQTLTQYITEFYPVLTNRWGIPKFNPLLSCTLS